MLSCTVSEQCQYSFKTMVLQFLFPQGHVLICAVEADTEESLAELEAVTFSQCVPLSELYMYVSSHSIAVEITSTRIDK